MTPREFCRIRRRYGWSGLQLAKVLGVGHSSPSRWEKGVVAIPESIARLMWLLDGLPECRQILEGQLPAPLPRGRPKAQVPPLV